VGILEIRVNSIKGRKYTALGARPIHKHLRNSLNKEMRMQYTKLIIQLVIVAHIVGCQSQNTIESRNKATVKRYIKEVVNNTSEDYSNAYEMISPNFIFYFGGEEFNVKGVDFFKSGDEDSKPFSKLVLIDDEMIAEGNTVAVRWHDKAIHDSGEYYGYQVVPDQKEMTWHGMSFYKFNNNGLIAEAYIVSDAIRVFEMRKRTVEKAEEN
jgi:SnoaL-like polyketide cyclase